MDKRTKVLLKPVALSLFVMTFFAVGQGVARADEVFIAGYTNGCFNCAIPEDISSNSGTTIGGLSYTNATFSGTTANGFLAFGGNPAPPVLQGRDNFGSFSLTDAPRVYTGNTFTLRVFFTAPEGIGSPPGSSALFTALLIGTVRSDTDGGVRIDFDNTPITFNFDDTNCQQSTLPGQQTTCGAGSFTLRINDLSINPGQTAEVTGDILGAQQPIPEPSTMILLGTGLAGVAAKVSRRRKASQT